MCYLMRHNSGDFIVAQVQARDQAGEYRDAATGSTCCAQVREVDQYKLPIPAWCIWAKYARLVDQARRDCHHAIKSGSRGNKPLLERRFLVLTVLAQVADMERARINERHGIGPCTG
jgi:hypothetical protein